MTHDELSKKLEGLWHDSFKAPGYQALRAVVELHKPEWVDCPCEDKNKCPDLACNTCFNEYKQREDYPCATIQAIEKELN